MKQIVIEPRFRILLVTALLLLPHGALRADLPAQAEEAVKQGLDAIQKKDYPLADGYFREAREKAGSEVYYDIGMAEAQIPGRELRAICWLAAYLADNPTGKKVAEARAKIDDLDEKGRTKVLDLVQAFQDALQKMPGEGDAKYSLRGIAGEWIRVGDFVSAKKVIDLTKDPDELTGLVTAQADAAQKQFEAGDVTGSGKTLAEAQKNSALVPQQADSYALYRIAIAQVGIARAQIKAGKMRDARKSIDEAEVTMGLENQSWTSETADSIATTEITMARAQLKAGDAVGAKASFAAAIKLADSVQKPKAPYKFELLRDIADAQTDAGDLDGAKQTLAAAISLPMVYNDAGNAQMEIVKAQVRAGDLPGAKTTADLIQGQPNWKFEARHSIAEGEIKSGDMAGARETLALARKAADLYTNMGAKQQALQILADAQVRAGNAAAARETLTAALATIDANRDYNADQKSWAWEQIAVAQGQAGDKEAAFKTAGLIQGKELKLKTLREIAQPPKKSEPVATAGHPPNSASFASESLALDGEESAAVPRVTGEAWFAMIEQSFDAPCFTAFADYSDCKAIAAEIEGEPVRLARHAGLLDPIQSMDLVTRRMVAAQVEVDGLLKLQLKK